ncbi:MAG: polysaccharide deacetylase family protein [Bacteroidales bacterium]|nr:polysaccharide deacetylase family protein [Bacteroidales bacterium]
MIKNLLPGLVWNIPAGNRKLYLTFDDGPHTEITGKVLEILEKYNASATFFCTGRNVERDPAIFNAIIQSGHAIGNHTYSHIKGWHTKNSEYYADVKLASRFIPSSLFRPPYGMIKPSQARNLLHYYKIFMWSLLSYDFRPDVKKEKCLDHVLKNSKPGSIIVFHDSVKASMNMLYALPRVLDHFSQQGFAFRKIPMGSEFNE